MTSDAGTGLTLAVTSSTGVMGIAVGQVGQKAVEHLGAVEIATDRRHAEEISPRMSGLLEAAGLRLSEIERLVIDIGPGRFTGLRVGLASIRALGFALNRPVVGLTSLSILAAGSETDSSGVVTAVIDARRNEVFQQTFDRGDPLGEATVGDPEVLAAAAVGLVVGDGLDRYLEHYDAALAGSNGSHETAATPVTGRNPSAAVMLELSRGVMGKPGTEVAPLYLRDPDANPNIKTRPVG